MAAGAHLSCCPGPGPVPAAPAASNSRFLGSRVPPFACAPRCCSAAAWWGCAVCCSRCSGFGTGAEAAGAAAGAAGTGAGAARPAWASHLARRCFKCAMITLGLRRRGASPLCLLASVRIGPMRGVCVFGRPAAPVSEPSQPTLNLEGRLALASHLLREVPSLTAAVAPHSRRSRGSRHQGSQQSTLSAAPRRLPPLAGARHEAQRSPGLCRAPPAPPGPS